MRARKSKVLEISASSNSFHRRKFRSRDCPLGKQSHANPNRPIQELRSDQFQPQNRQGFAFELLRKPHRLATTARPACSRGEFLKLLIPCNLRTRRLLQVSDLYRGFECLPLRHAVWTAEKFHRPFPRNMRKMPVFRDYSLINRTGENGLSDSKEAFLLGFSLEGTCAVRFLRGH